MSNNSFRCLRFGKQCNKQEKRKCRICRIKIRTQSPTKIFKSTRGARR